MSENEPIEGRVAGILTKRRLIMNKGEQDGIRPNMKFTVHRRRPIVVKDPETGEDLGILDPVKVRVQTMEVYDRFAICETYIRHEVPGDKLWQAMNTGGFLASAGMGAGRPPQVFYETLAASTEDEPLDEDKSRVKTGDRMVEIVPADNDASRSAGSLPDPNP